MTDRIASAFATWDHYVADVARDGGTVDPTEGMAGILINWSRPVWQTRWECVEVAE